MLRRGWGTAAGSGGRARASPELIGAECSSSFTGANAGWKRGCRRVMRTCDCRTLEVETEKQKGVPRPKCCGER